MLSDAGHMLADTVDSVGVVVAAILLQVFGWMGADLHAVLDDARHCLAERHGITHGTFQVEPDDHEGCDRDTW